MKINTTCFLEINSSKINCKTNEDVSLLAKRSFRIPKFDSQIIFPCENNKKEKFNCQISPFDIEDNVGYSYSQVYIKKNKFLLKFLIKIKI